MKKLAIVSTHPIQYNAPMFRLLAERAQIDLKVFYTWSQAKEKVKDKTFGREIQWDIPLLKGYKYEFIENISKHPGTNRWTGIDNPNLISRIEDYDPNAVLVFGWNMKSHFKVMRHFKGKVPVWFRGDSTLIDESKGLKTILRRILLTYVYSYVDKALFVGKENKKYFKAHKLKESQLSFAPHAIDNKRFFDSIDSSYEDTAKEWRSELGYAKDDILILFAGKFEEKKDPLLLVRTVQKINISRDQKLKLLMVGNGPLEQEINNQIRLDENIKLLPFQNQSKMPLVYRLGDIFCLPSKGPGETWGLAVNEAMACSRPVVVTNKVGCAPDLVEDGAVGAVFSSGNSIELQEKLLRISKENTVQMGENSHQFIRKWSFEKICETIERELHY